MTIQDFILQYPRAYHMAESGTWQSIQKNGLLSTTALLDLFEISGEDRDKIERQHRADSITITHRRHGSAVIRDQKPMSESALQKCLKSGLTPAQWFQILNKRVFFWVSEKRLQGLLAARAYRSKQHCVITIDTAALVSCHANSITLSPINSGSTIFKPQPRGNNTFSSIFDYPFERWKLKRNAERAVVELAVDYSVPNLADLVLRVDERKGNNILETLYERIPHNSNRTFY